SGGRARGHQEGQTRGSRRSGTSLASTSPKPRFVRGFVFWDNAGMARLTKLSKTEVTGDVRELYDRVGQQRGNVPNMFRLYAHRPEILKTMVAHMNAV